MTLPTIALFAVPGSSTNALLQGLSARLLAAGIAAEVSVADVISPPLDVRPGFLTLLAGNDAQAPDDDAHVVQAFRAHLMQAGQPFQVLYGTHEERLDQAMAAVRSRRSITGTKNASTPTTQRRPWVWACEKCSDPECEHRLLSDLLAARA